MVLDFFSAQVQDYMDGIVPDRPDEMRLMEAFAKSKGFPIIGPACGYFCYQIARMIKAKNVFELGSGYGYSTAWFAWAVKKNGGGKVHHVVWEKELSQMACKSLSELGFDDVVEYHIGEAIETLRDTSGPFDLIFNDIDKNGYPESLPVIKDKLRSGGVLIIDNMLWGGRIFDQNDQEPDTQGVRKFTKEITNDKDWIISLVPIRDGLIIAFKE